MPNESPASMSSAEEKIAARMLGRFEQLFLRPLFLFVTFVLVLMALLQGGGRLAMVTMSFQKTLL